MSEKEIYISERDSAVFLPTQHYSLNEARKEAASYAQMEMGGFGRARYLGRKDASMHDHDEPWDRDCCSESAWCFETYEGTWRR